MRTRALAAVAALLLVAGAGGSCRRGADASSLPAAPLASHSAERPRLQFYKNPAAVPAVMLTDLDGRRFSSAEWRGKVTLVNFWATWCPPCRAEIPDLIRLQQKYGDHLQIVGISEDDAPLEVVKAFVAANNINYRVAMTNPEVEKAFPGISVLPTTLLIDREGRIVQRHLGMLTAETTELEARSLAGLPVDALVEQVDKAQPLKIENTAQLKTIPGVDLAALTPARRAEALQKLNSEGCTCGCDLTLARCRVEDPSCGVSLPLARKLVAEIAAQP